MGLRRGVGWTHLQVDANARTGWLIGRVATAGAPANNEGTLAACERRVHMCSMPPGTCASCAATRQCVEWARGLAHLLPLPQLNEDIESSMSGAWRTLRSTCEAASRPRARCVVTTPVRPARPVRGLNKYQVHGSYTPHGRSLRNAVLSNWRLTRYPVTDHTDQQQLKKLYVVKAMSCYPLV